MFSEYFENYSNFYIIEKSSGLFSKAIFINQYSEKTAVKV